MPLRTRQALPHSAIVANEHFFSHAKEVLRHPVDLAKRCFSRVPGNVATQWREKNVFYHEKRLAMGIPVSTMRLESRSYYEHDDRAETLFGCPSHSVGIGALRDCGEFQRALSSADNQ
jgi:hypothetical protein